MTKMVLKIMEIGFVFILINLLRFIELEFIEKETNYNWVNEEIKNNYIYRKIKD